jgi:pimeloyl-ACP methyl ester carboxylesterase
MPEERTYHTGEVTINYAEYGGQSDAANARNPLVLLHGGSARWQASLPAITEFRGHRHIYAPDLRGHGKSGWVPGRYNMQDYAADVAALLGGVVRRPAVLYGHSLGGQVAITAAASRPHLVAGLMIGDSPFNRDKLRSALARDRERLLLWREMSGPSHSLDEIAAALMEMPVYPPQQAEPVPAHVLFGDTSPWFPYMAECLHLLDPDMLTAVLEFEEMHAAYDCEQLFPLITCPVPLSRGILNLGAG